MFVKGIKIFLKTKKTKSVNIVVNTVKILQKMKNKSYFSMGKFILEFKKKFENKKKKVNDNKSLHENFGIFLFK